MGCVLSKEEDRKSSLPITVITLATLVKELREGRCSSGSSACNSFSEGLDLVVMDRFHSFGDGNYGSLWEEAIMFLDHKVCRITGQHLKKTKNVERKNRKIGCKKMFGKRWKLVDKDGHSFNA